MGEGGVKFAFSVAMVLIDKRKNYQSDHGIHIREKNAYLQNV